MSETRAYIPFNKDKSERDTMTKQNSFAQRGRQIVKDIAHGPHGRSAELNRILDGFIDETDGGRIAALLKDLQTHLAEVLPGATPSEARLFGQEAAYAKNDKDLGRHIGVLTAAYAKKLDELASAEGQGGSNPATSPGDGSHKEGPGNPSPRKDRGRNDPR